MSGGPCHLAPSFTTLVRSALSIGFLVWASAAVANKPKNIEDVEMKLIPAYCPDTMGFKYGDAYSRTSPKAAHWVSLMGNDFWHMHHYCWARINLNRAYKSGISAQAKKALLNSVRSDYMYVINNAQKNFIMLPEVYTRLGEVELLLGSPNKANDAFSRARIQKQDYWPAYSRWAEYLLSIGRRKEALRVVIDGLAHSPESRVLLELFKTLGGKPSDMPAPIKESEPDPSPGKEGPEGDSEKELGDNVTSE